MSNSLSCIGFGSKGKEGVFSVYDAMRLKTLIVRYEKKRRNGAHTMYINTYNKPNGQKFEIYLL